MKTNPLMKTALALLATAAAPWALAHPGHGDEASWGGLAHLLEAEHLLPVLAVVAVALVARRAWRGQAARQAKAAAKAAPRSPR